MAERSSENFFEYLELSMDQLAAEAPRHFHAMRAHLGTLAVSIQLGDGAPRRICLADGANWLSRGTRADVTVALDRATLDAFLHGQLTIEQALTESRLAVRGKLDHVLACLDALQAWLHGTLRSPSAPRLHRRYLDGKDPSPARESREKGSQ